MKKQAKKRVSKKPQATCKSDTDFRKFIADKKQAPIGEGWSLEQEVAHLRERWVIAKNEAVSLAALVEVLAERLADAENKLRLEKQRETGSEYIAFFTVPPKKTKKRRR